MLTWKKSAFALVFVGSAMMSLFSFSCGGGGFSCDAKGGCANDPAPTQAQIDACNKLVNDATCGAKFQAAGDCAADQPASCDANGKSMASTSTACKTQTDDYTACLLSALTDGGTGG